jgi:hypothetical protein
MVADTSASLRAMSVLALASDTTNQLIAAGAALGGAIIGGLLTFMTALIQNRQAREAREAEAANARRARAGEILGRVRVFLTDVDPARIGINVNKETTPNQLEALGVRLNVLRDELAMFAASFDDDAVMTRIAQLEVALFNTFNQSSWHASDLLRNRDALVSLEVAQGWHGQAGLLVRIVLELVRGRDVADLEAALAKIDPKAKALSEPL